MSGGRTTPLSRSGTTGSSIRAWKRKMLPMHVDRTQSHRRVAAAAAAAAAAASHDPSSRGIPAAAPSRPVDTFDSERQRRLGSHTTTTRWLARSRGAATVGALAQPSAVGTPRAGTDPQPTRDIHFMGSGWARTANSDQLARPGPSPTPVGPRPTPNSPLCLALGAEGTRTVACNYLRSSLPTSTSQGAWLGPAEHPATPAPHQNRPRACTLHATLTSHADTHSTRTRRTPYLSPRAVGNRLSCRHRARTRTLHRARTRNRNALARAPATALARAPATALARAPRPRAHTHTTASSQKPTATHALHARRQLRIRQRRPPVRGLGPQADRGRRLRVARQPHRLEAPARVHGD